MNNLNIDQTIGYVRKIVENIQCAICDKTNGQRLRYACGHTVCDNCGNDAIDCQLCLTPPHHSSPKPKLDNALTQRVKNTSELLKACQDLYNTDVFKHKRLSEQLRIEKELFPECIQAPAKYENKRKSTFISIKNKENSRNSTFFPGEETSLSSVNIAMESSAKYVQQWLNKNDKELKRKPLRDLNVNTPLDHHNIILPQKKYKLQSKHDENAPLPKITRKRSHFKTIVNNNPLQSEHINTIINQHNGSSKKVKKEICMYNADLVRNKTKTDCDYDESGIFMDDDPIVIDDSQNTVIDKDKNAWLAVFEANKHEEIESTSLVNLDCRDNKTLIDTNQQIPTQSDGMQSTINPNIKVPFYKKGYLTETCTYCNAAADKVVGQSEKVEITIDNPSFTTIIKIIKDVENSSKLKTTNSVLVQTNSSNSDDNIGFTNFNDKFDKEEVVSQKSYVQSEDLFGEDGQNIGSENKQNNLHKCLVIAESDSDMEMEGSGPLPVKVDVHRACDESEYGILSEIVNIQEHDTRQRRGPRGYTPTSTDSSDKENYNPNRMKKHTISKKKKFTRK